MSDTVREYSAVDSLPRLIFLGVSAAAGMFSLSLGVNGKAATATVGLIFALVMWLCWLVLFIVQTGGG